MQKILYPYFPQNMQINSHNLDVGSRTHNSKSTETGSISSSQIPPFSTEPNIRNINLTQEPDEKVKDTVNRRVWRMTKASQKHDLQFQAIQLWAMGKARNIF